MEETKIGEKDAAKLRDALVKAATMLAVCEWPDGTDMEGVAKLRRDIDAALAAPPRNCDVGTVEEQQERFAKYCRVHSDAHECGIGYAIGNPKAKCPAYKTIDCQLVWAQMPYEEGGANE